MLNNNTNKNLILNNFKNKYFIKINFFLKSKTTKPFLCKKSASAKNILIKKGDETNKNVKT